MLTRRTLLQGVGFVLAAGLAGCNRDHRPVIGVVPQGRTHMFWQTVQAGARAAGREINAVILWNGPATETDYRAQLQIVETMINRRVSALALSPIDRQAMSGVVERAMKEGIPVIIFDSPIETQNFVAEVATDNYLAGQMAAERLGAILNGQGRIVMVATQPGASSTLAREAGFEAVLKTKYPGIQIVDKRFGMSDYAKSLQVAENMLTAFPELDGMFASNESSTVGAMQALRGRQSKVKLVGFDSSQPLLEAVRSGLIDALVVQDPFRMGYQAVMLAHRKLNGETPPKTNSLAPKLVTLANLDDPEIQTQLHPDLEKYLKN